MISSWTHNAIKFGTMLPPGLDDETLENMAVWLSEHPTGTFAEYVIYCMDNFDGEGLEPINIEGMVESIPQSGQVRCLVRALKRTDVEFEIVENEHGTQIYVDAEDSLADNDEIVTLFQEELLSYAADIALQRLVDEGLIDRTVNENGEHEYSVTKAGEEFVKGADNNG